MQVNSIIFIIDILHMHMVFLEPTMNLTLHLALTREGGAFESMEFN